MKWIAFTVLGIMMASPALAARTHQTVFLRDSLHEEYLKTRADPDSKITPARVLRWLRGMNGTAVAPQETSTAEFQPTLDTKNGDYKVIAAVTFKFD